MSVFRKPPTTPEEAVATILDHLEDGEIAEAIQVTKVCLLDEFLETATLGQYMVITSPYAFTRYLEPWMEFRKYWCIAGLKNHFSDTFSLEVYLSSVMWLVKLLVNYKKFPAAYEVLVDALLYLNKYWDLMEMPQLLNELGNNPDFREYIELLNARRELLSS